MAQDAKTHVRASGHAVAHGLPGAAGILSTIHCETVREITSPHLILNNREHGFGIIAIQRDGEAKLSRSLQTKKVI